MDRCRELVVVALTFVPWICAAQVTPPFTSREMRPPRLVTPPQGEAPRPDPTEAVKKACDALLLTNPVVDFPERKGAAAGYDLVGTCADYLANEIVKQKATEDTTAQNRAYIQIRVSYKILRRWTNVDRGTGNELERRTAGARLDSLEEALDDALKAAGLFAPFSATLTTGPSFTDTKKDDKGEEKTKTLALGVVNWESRHFGDISLEPIDISFGGRIGVQPVLAVVAPANTAEGAEPALTGTQQSAFVWTLDLNLHRQHRAINAEYGWFTRTGAAMLTSVPSIVDRERGSFVALPVDNGAGKTAWLWESGLQFTMFDNRLAQMHAEGGMTAPQFQLGVAWRHDRRFKRAGALADYDRPEHRLVFRMTIDALQVLDKRAFGQQGKTFMLGFSVEHERDFFGSGRTVPSATRYMLRGDVDLLKGLTSNDLPKAPTAPATPAPPPAQPPKVN